MSARGHESFRDDVAPYVLGALEEAELEAFAAHMQTCAECRDDVASFDAVVAVLPLASPQLLAPGELKRRVMGHVREESAEPQPASAPRRRRRSWRPALAPVALAVAAAAVIALVAVVLAGGGGSATRTYRAAVHPPGASVLVTVDGSHAQLTMSGMPVTERGRVYELWIKRNGAPAPTDALFTVTRGGRATVGVPANADGIRALLVTSEPLGGSAAPTRAPAIIAAIG